MLTENVVGFIFSLLVEQTSIESRQLLANRLLARFKQTITDVDTVCDENGDNEEKLYELKDVIKFFNCGKVLSQV